MNLLVWLFINIVLIIGIFYFSFQAVKSKNPKYGYPIAGLVILMGGMLFL